MKFPTLATYVQTTHRVEMAMSRSPELNPTVGRPMSLILIEPQDARQGTDILPQKSPQTPPPNSLFQTTIPTTGYRRTPAMSNQARPHTSFWPSIGTQSPSPPSPTLLTSPNSPTRVGTQKRPVSPRLAAFGSNYGYDNSDSNICTGTETDRDGNSSFIDRSKQLMRKASAAILRRINSRNELLAEVCDEGSPSMPASDPRPSSMDKENNFSLLGQDFHGQVQHTVSPSPSITTCERGSGTEPLSHLTTTDRVIESEDHPALLRPKRWLSTSL